MKKEFHYSKDLTHDPIKDYLESKGYKVFDVANSAGLGFDLVVYAPALDRWGVTECKTPRLSRAKQGARRYSMANRKAPTPRLTESEVKAAQEANVKVALTGEEAEQNMFGAYL